jgi:hypothetical protein
MEFCAKLIAVAVVSALLQTAGEYPALPSIPFDEPGEYAFHFRLTHTREMTLLLDVVGSKGEPDRPELTHLWTIIEVTLINHAGHTVCQAAGSPTVGISSTDWVLRTTQGGAAFWHQGCGEIKLKRSESYTLKLRIRDVDPKAPRLRLTPILERSDDYGP